jgi:hypothetical protein
MVILSTIKYWNPHFCFSAGLSIVIMTNLFVSFGVNFILLFLSSLELPEQVVAIYI